MQLRNLGVAIVALMMGVTVAHAEGVRLQFKDTDINVFTEYVAEKIGKTIVVNPRVAGKITVISPKPVDARELYNIYVSVLQTIGAVPIEEGSIVKIVPEQTARTSVEGEFSTEVFEAKHVSATQLANSLRQFLTPNGFTNSPQGSNVVIIADRAGNLRRLLDIARRVDRASDNGYARVTLRHADVTTVIKIVEKIFAQEKVGASKGSRKAPKMVADPANNSILIVGDTAARARAERILRDMDIPTNSESGATQVIPLRFAKAEEIAPILQGYAQAAQQADKAVVGKKAQAAAGQTAATIIAHTQTNSLVITAPPKVLQALKNVVSKLDIRRKQVLVEAIIAEISDENGENIGIQLAGDVGGGVFVNELGPAVGLGIGQVVAAAIGDSTAQAALAGSLPIGLTLAGAAEDSQGRTRFGYLLNALNRDGNTRILSTPSLLALDNEESQISIGREVPFITGNFTTNSNGSNNPFQTIERRDVGITLKITPHVIDDNTVELAIDQEISSISAGSFGAADLVTDKRTITTKAIIENGELIVLGGLIDEKTLSSMQKVPLLGDIPVIGALFRNQSETTSRQNLMIFVRPLILNNAADGRRVTDRNYRFMEGQLQRPLEPAYNLPNAPVYNPSTKQTSPARGPSSSVDDPRFGPRR